MYNALLKVFNSDEEKMGDKDVLNALLQSSTQTWEYFYLIYIAVSSNYYTM